MKLLPLSMDDMCNKRAFGITEDPANGGHHQEETLFEFENPSSFADEDSTHANRFNESIDGDHISYICGSDVLIGASETIETEISEIDSKSEDLQDVPHDSALIILSSILMADTMDLISGTSHEILSSPLDPADADLDSSINNSLVNVLSEQSGENLNITKDKTQKLHRTANDIIQNEVKRKRVRKTHLVNKSKPTCTNCEVEFSTKSSLKRHMLTHSEGNVVGSKRGRKAHFGHLLKPTCSICSVEFTNTASLKTHMLIHSGERPFQCDLCEKSFARKTVLGIHRRLHTGERPYKCKLCREDFVTKEALARHVIKDHAVETNAGSQKEKPSYKCDVCQKTLCSKYSLQSHMNIHRLKQSDDEEAGVKCKICKKKFTCRYTLQRHVFEKHNLPGIITCNICEMSFSSKWEHSKHQDTHATSRQFQCDLCAKTFDKKFQLLYHLQVHEAEKAIYFSCYLCKKQYTSRETFLSHILGYVQCEMQIYSCPQCPISFSDPRQLKLHLNETHELPLISDLNYCDICKLSSTDSNSYYEHLFGAHDYVDILCNECGCYFKSRRQYDEHFMAHFL